MNVLEGPVFFICLPTSFVENMKNFESQTQKLDNKINDLESRSMRENLLFYGIKEDDGEN